MNEILFAPHNDDETLFAAFTCMTVRPYVVVCLRSYRQEHAAGITWQTRERETEQAMNHLGCAWSQWNISDVNPDWALIEREMRLLDETFSPQPSAVYAPFPDFERNGWTPGGRVTGYGLYHHDMIGWCAGHVFGDRVRYYHTYSRYHGRTEEGVEVEPTPQMVIAKLAALSCYQSQIAEKSTRMHFLGSQREWLAA